MTTNDDRSVHGLFSLTKQNQIESNEGESQNQDPMDSELIDLQLLKTDALKYTQQKRNHFFCIQFSKNHSSFDLFFIFLFFLKKKNS